MIDRFVAESSEYEFKVAIETKKPRSWLKTVCGYANCIGGELLFGVDDNRNVVGLENIQEGSEYISRMIKDKIDLSRIFF